jgi:hypothetical protein
MFGDRVNVVVPNLESDSASIRERLAGAGIAVTSWRVIPPSLENVFISLLKAS